MKKIIIAIDGYSSTGKSTIAKRIANILHYIYIDTGAMYRAATLLALRRGFITTINSVIHIQEKALIEALSQSTFNFIYNPAWKLSELYLNDENIEKEIRGIQVANFVSEIARIQEVRTYLVALQRKMGIEKGIVMDGRDIGTVVFPHAELKIFMTASEEIRAQRRFLELQAKGESTTYEEVLQNIQKRDYQDSHRSESPLIKAIDAIEIDNSYTTIEEVVTHIVHLAEVRIEA